MMQRFETGLPGDCRHMAFLVWTTAVSLMVASSATCDDQWRSEDPFATIDGHPLFWGELNLVLVERFGADQVQRLDLPVRQAAASLLVRRQIALRTLRTQGGQSLQAVVEREIQTFENELQRLGSDLEEYAKQRFSTEQSVRSDLEWKISWGHYLKSQLTEANLRRYFESHQSLYGGARWQVSQIFLPVDRSDAAAARETRAKMTAFAAQIQDSPAPTETFADLATKHSQSKSSHSGGRIGWVETDGDLPKSVMQAIRNTQPGKLSPIVLSPLGLHLVFVHQTEVKPTTFDELQDISTLRRDAANALIDRLVQRQQDVDVRWIIKELTPPTEMENR